MQKLGHAIEKSEKEQHTAEQTIKQMEQDHEWISNEKENFRPFRHTIRFQGAEHDGVQVSIEESLGAVSRDEEKNQSQSDEHDRQR